MSRQRTCLSTFADIMEELSKWTSKESAHNLPAKDRPSILPAQYALTPLFETPDPAHSVGASVEISVLLQSTNDEFESPKMSRVRKVEEPDAATLPSLLLDRGVLYML